MIFALLAAALAADVPSVDLELVCPGQYQDVETTTAETTQFSNGKYNNGTATLNTEVTREGTARVSLHGTAGALTYPDGRQRKLVNVTADERHITGTYDRRVLIVNITWHVDINRLTGDIRVSNGHYVSFQGMCSAAPTQPKF